jgi:hypothetical protein
MSLRQQRRVPAASKGRVTRRLEIDLLEDRLAPGSLLSLSGFLSSDLSALEDTTAGQTSTKAGTTTSSTTTTRPSSSTTPTTTSSSGSTTGTGSKSTTITTVTTSRAGQGNYDALQAATLGSTNGGTTGGSSGRSGVFGFGGGSLPPGSGGNTNPPGGSSSPKIFDGDEIRGRGLPISPNALTKIARRTGNQVVNMESHQPNLAAGDLGEGTYDKRITLNLPRLNLNADQVKDLAQLRKAMPKLMVNVDGTFGAPSSIHNEGGFLTAPSASAPLDVVTNFIAAHKALFGLKDQDIQGLQVTDLYTDTVGMPVTHVYLQETVGGIGVYHSVTGASVMPDGRLINVANRLIPNVTDSVNTLTPTISAADAIRNAAANAGLTVSGDLTLLSGPTGPDRSSVYSNGSVSREDIPVKLVLLPIRSGDVRLAWNVQLNVPGTPDYFETNVDATTGEVWTRLNWTKFDSYRVYALPGENPQDTKHGIVSNPADVNLASPFGWHNRDDLPGPEFHDTRGNNVFAQDNFDGTGNNGQRPTGFFNNDYDYKNDLYQPPDVSIDAAIVNLFYVTNMLHDISYRHGFTEAAGNFQDFTFGRGGRGNDHVIANALDDFDNGSRDNAFFSPRVDGVSGIIAMFAWDFTNPERDGDFENQIILHEYGHGISTRLDGGPGTVSGLNGIQSGGAGEGWSDWFALWATTRNGDPSDGKYPTGNWVLGFPQDGPGVRRVPYSTNKTDDPLTYKYVNPRYAPYGSSEVHDVGEIWCTILWEMNWNLIKKYGYSTDFFTGNGGNNVAMRLVIEGLKLTPVNPTFIDSRNAILAADLALFGGANHAEIWKAFAKRGVGYFADDGGGHNQVNVRENFTLPPSFPGGGGGPGSPSNPGHDRFETNDSSDKATQLGTLSSQLILDTLSISKKSSLDKDWFRFSTANGGQLSVRIDMATGSGDLDLRVYARNSNGGLTLLGKSTTRQKGGSEEVKVNVSAGRDLYVQVYGYGSSVGVYDLTITPP